MKRPKIASCYEISRGPFQDIVADAFRHESSIIVECRFQRMSVVTCDYLAFKPIGCAYLATWHSIIAVGRMLFRSLIKRVKSAVTIVPLSYRPSRLLPQETSYTNGYCAGIFWKHITQEGRYYLIVSRVVIPLKMSIKTKSDALQSRLVICELQANWQNEARLWHKDGMKQASYMAAILLKHELYTCEVGLYFAETSATHKTCHL